MKGLMVTLLVVLGSGSSLAQQFGGNEFSADRTSRPASQNSSPRTNQTPLQPLNRNFDNTSMRVAQSSTANDGGFRPTSVQTIGGSDYEEDSDPSRTMPAADAKRDPNSRLYSGQDYANANGRQPQSTPRQRSSSSMDSRRGFSADQASQARSSSNSNTPRYSTPRSDNQLRAWPLPVSPEWGKTLKSAGYLYAKIEPEDRSSIGEVVMFQDGSKFRNPSGTGSNVMPNQWEVYKDTAIIDVDDFDLQEIEKGTLTLRNLGVENLTGVALRYVRNDGDKIDVRRIGNIPGNASTIENGDRSDFGRNSATATGGTYSDNRLNERRSDQRRQRDVSFSNQNQRQNARRDFDSPARDMIDDGDWDLNDNQRVRRPRETRRPFQRDEQLVSQRDPRDRFVNEDRNSSRSNDRRLSDDYFDNFQRREFDDRDQRDIDYVRNRINQGRGDDYLSPNDARSRRYADEIRSIEPYSRSGRTRSDGRSSDYDTNFASQQRELQERLLVAKRLEVKNAENAAWLERQRESMEAARVARFYEDDLTPLRSGSSINDNLSTDRYSFGDERLADRSTDPNYRGRRTDALSPARSSNASAARVAQILADKEADLDAKMGAIDHLLKLDEAGRNLDSKINSIKNGNQPQNNLGGRVQSLVSQTVPNTLGGDLATARYPRVASIGTGIERGGLNGGAPPLDINSYQQRGQRPRGTSSYDDQPTSSASDGRMLRLMWLLLLISLGANFYLAMLSRSFYTQYEELADELRETFSTSSTI